MRVLEGERRDRDPLRRRLRAGDRRPRSRARARRPRPTTGSSSSTASSRRSAPPTTRCEGGEGIWWDYRDWSARDAACRPWSAPGRRPSPAATAAGRDPVAVECMGGAAGACADGARPASRRRGEAGRRADAARRDPGPRRPLGAAARRPGRRQTRGRPGGERRLRRVRAPAAPASGSSGSTSRGGGTRPRLRCRAGRRHAPLRSAAGLGRDRRRRRPASPPPRAARRRATCATITRSRSKGTRRRRCRWVAMRSPFAYTPRPRAAAGGLAGRRGRLPRRPGRRSPSSTRARWSCSPPAWRWRRPGCWPGPGGAVRAALRMGLALALLIVAVNALVVNRGETVLARLGDWPLLGQVDVTAEAIVDGARARPARGGRDGRLRRLLGLRRPRPGAAGAAPDRRALGADRDAGLAPGPGRRRRRRAGCATPPACAARGAAAGRPGAAGPPPARRLARSRRRRRRDAGAARLRPRRAAGASRPSRRRRSPLRPLASTRVGPALLAAAIAAQARSAPTTSTPTRRSRSAPVPRPSPSPPWSSSPASPRAPSRRAIRRGLTARPRRRPCLSWRSAARRAGAGRRGPHLRLSATPTRPALRDVSLEVAAGEFVLLAGRSASGKSTLLRAACGLVPHFHGGEIEGRVEVAGIDAIEAGPGELAARVGYVAQDPETQVVSTTVAAEIELPLEMRGDAAGRPRPRRRGGRPRPGDPAPARPHRRHPLRRRAAAGRARRRPGHPPALVLLDEPTSQLDPVAGDELIWLLRRLNEEWGVAVLLAEHRLERCLAAADRVVAMDSGRSPSTAPRATSSAWAQDADPALETPAARLFSLAGIEPLARRRPRRATHARAGGVG